MEEYVDDMSGQKLYTQLVREARQLDMKKLSEHMVYTKVPISEAIKVTGVKPLGSRWVVIKHATATRRRLRAVSSVGTLGLVGGA